MPHKTSKDGELSVTEVLSLVIDKPFLRFWFGKYGIAKCQQIQRESQELGILVHKGLETYLTTGVIEDSNKNVERMINNFIHAFAEPFGVVPLNLEVELIDKDLKLHGSYDAYIDTCKGRYIADWKTSNQLDTIGVPLQLCAYAHMVGADKGVAVRIDKEKDVVQVEWYESLAPYWPIFSSCLKVARYIKFGVENNV